MKIWKKSIIRLSHALPHLLETPVRPLHEASGSQPRFLSDRATFSLSPFGFLSRKTRQLSQTQWPHLKHVEIVKGFLFSHCRSLALFSVKRGRADWMWRSNFICGHTADPVISWFFTWRFLGSVGSRPLVLILVIKELPERSSGVFVYCFLCLRKISYVGEST